MTFVSKKEADAHDRMMDAAAEISELIESTDIPINENDMEILALYLVQHATRIKEILKPLKGLKPDQLPEGPG